MSLPGNRIAVGGERQPVWDREGVRWSWYEDRQLFICDDPNYDGPPVVEPGAIPRERQPFYAHPPTLREQVAAEMHPDER